MKDTILNTIVIATAFAAIVFAALDDNGSPMAAAQQAQHVPVMEKTVVVAKRESASEAMLVATAAQ